MWKKCGATKPFSVYKVKDEVKKYASAKVTPDKSCLVQFNDDKDEVASQNSEEDAKSQKEEEKKSDTKKVVTLDDFEIKSVVGRGSFGKVYLVEEKATS